MMRNDNRQTPECPVEALRGFVAHLGDGSDRIEVVVLKAVSEAARALKSQNEQGASVPPGATEGEATDEVGQPDSDSVGASMPLEVDDSVKEPELNDLPVVMVVVVVNDEFFGHGHEIYCDPESLRGAVNLHAAENGPGSRLPVVDVPGEWGYPDQWLLKGVFDGVGGVGEQVDEVVSVTLVDATTGETWGFAERHKLGDKDYIYGLSRCQRT